jgi:hypothetical protein
MREEVPIIKNSIGLSDTSHISYPATSSIPPGVIEIIRLPASFSRITLGHRDWGVGGIFAKKKNPGVRYGLYS